MTKSTTVSLLAAVSALLALPAAGQAATTVGSDLLRADGNSHTVGCDDGQGQIPCTLIADREPWGDIEAPDAHIITSWSAQLDAGAKARLRLLRRNDDGSFTGAGESALVTASRSGVQSFKTHIHVPPGDFTIGVDLLEGGMGTIVDDTYEMTYSDPPIAEGQTRTGTTIGHELLLSAKAEEDLDEDLKGDETEDDCVFGGCDPGNGGGGNGGGGAPGGGGGGGVVVPPTQSLDVPIPDVPADPGGVPDDGPDFTVDTRALLRPGAEGRQGHFELFAENAGSGEADATFELRAGSRSLGRRTVEDLESGDDTTVRFRLSAGQRKQLRRKGKLKLALTASATHADGKTTPVRQDVTLVRGGATKYDGQYKGPGPIVFVVQGGAVRTVSSQVNAFCPRSNRHQELSIFSIDGFPPLVKPDGSFAADGRAAGQAMKYHGKLSLRGKSKGYASAYRFELGVSDSGRYFTDGCTGAINWTATKVK